MRKHTAAAMVRSAFTAPHVTSFLTVDVTPTIELIERLAERRDLAGHRIGVLALVAAAFVHRAARAPELNCRWDEAAQEIVQYGYVNLGIAAATERGLVVPNIQDADAMSLLDLADALADLTQEARAGKTPPERMSGGTFTITNVGVFGVDAGTPILNPGEAGSWRSARRSRPWEYRGEIALRDVMTLSLSFDHRLVDGEQGARFLADVGRPARRPGARDAARRRHAARCRSADAELGAQCRQRHRLAGWPGVAPRPLCGVELMRPNAGVRAQRGARRRRWTGRAGASTSTHSSTYSRCRSRTDARSASARLRGRGPARG